MMYFAVFLVIFFLPFIASASGIEELCKQMTEKAKTPVWGADYIAGVDVHGNHVVSADLNGGAGGVHDPVVIPVRIDLAEKFDLILPSGMDLKPKISTIRIFEDGRVTYNDKNITSEVRQICDDNDEEKAKLPPKPHGQNGGDTLPSDDKIQGQYPEYNE